VILYRLLMRLFALREIATRVLKRDLVGCNARLGRIASPTSKKHIWIHAASNGEVTSAKPVITRLATNGRHIFLTVNTDSAVDLVRGWGLAHVAVQLAPLDLPGPTARVYARWKISAHITIESELWPHRILTCPGPVIVLGGRLTARSAKGWRRFESLARRVVSKISYLSAQDASSLERFSDFGLKARAKGPVYDLKALYVPPEDALEQNLMQTFDRANTWLAASTHEGEDAVILAAHAAALKQRPHLRLILAPRHPKRADAIATLAKKHGFTLARRSLNEDPHTAQIYLADTLGEMALWYKLAGTTFVAGSLTDRGGHTPYEPAYFGSVIIHGPDTANFKSAYTRLKNKNTSICISDAETLSDALIGLKEPIRQKALGEAAKSALQQDTDIDALMEDIMHTLNA
jgi:3-deoxy-D-manno-octulosonic-acid transferase